MMLHLNTFSIASGSSGNSYYISSADTAVLIDVGISAKRVKEAILASNLRRPEAIFITHEHSDHISGLQVLARHWDLPIFMTEGTYTAWLARVPKAEYAKVHIIEARTKISFRDLCISSVAAFHDAVEPLIFKVENSHSAISVCTDLGYVNKDIIDFIMPSSLVYLEANYDENMLSCGPYPRILQERIAGELGHLSNEDAAFVATCLLGSTRKTFVLSHLSLHNNQADLAKLIVENALNKQGALAEEDYKLLVADRTVAGAVMKV